MFLTWQLQSTCSSSWRPRPTMIGPACYFSFCSQCASYIPPRTHFSDRAEVFAVSVTWMSFFIVAHFTSSIHQEFTQATLCREVFPSDEGILWACRMPLQMSVQLLHGCLLYLCCPLTVGSWVPWGYSCLTQFAYSSSSTGQASQRFQTDMFHVDGADSRGTHQLKPSSQGGISVNSRCRKAVTANQGTQSFLEWVTTNIFLHV